MVRRRSHTAWGHWLPCPLLGDDEDHTPVVAPNPGHRPRLVYRDVGSPFPGRLPWWGPWWGVAPTARSHRPLCRLSNGAEGDAPVVSPTLGLHVLRATCPGIGASSTGCRGVLLPTAPSAVPVVAVAPGRRVPRAGPSLASCRCALFSTAPHCARAPSCRPRSAPSVRHGGSRPIRLPRTFG